MMFLIIPQGVLKGVESKMYYKYGSNVNLNVNKICQNVYNTYFTNIHDSIFGSLITFNN